MNSQRFASGAVAFVVPWLLLAMGSPFYTEGWIGLTLGLWLVGLTIGGVLWICGPKPRRVGGNLVVGVLVGGCLFVLLFGLVVFMAPV